jgi:hypothetical protein
MMGHSYRLHIGTIHSLSTRLDQRWQHVLQLRVPARAVGVGVGEGAGRSSISASKDGMERSSLRADSPHSKVAPSLGFRSRTRAQGPGRVAGEGEGGGARPEVAGERGGAHRLRRGDAHRAGDLEFGRTGTSEREVANLLANLVYRG